jgi:hypothetical protein
MKSMSALTLAVSIPGALSAALIVATLYSSQAIALRAFGNVERTVRWSASVALGVCAAITTFQWLLTFGRFRILETLVVAAFAVTATRASTGVKVASVIELIGEDVRALSHFLLGANKWFWPLRAGLIGAAGNVVARALILPPLGYDTLTYHGPRAAMWATTGREATLRMPGGWAMYRHFPSGGESLGAWAMLPLHDDTFYILVDAALWLAWLPVLAALCNEVDLPRRSRAALCLYVMTIPAIYFFVPSGYVDVSSHLLLISMTLFALRAVSGKTARASACLAIACGLTALTIKVTALAMPVIVAAAMLLATRRVIADRIEVLRGIGLGGALGLCALGPMLVRATLEQGYPFSPFPLRILGITLGVAPPELAWWNEPPPELNTRANEIHQLAMLFGVDQLYWPSFGAASIPLVLLAPLGLYMLFRERRWPALLLGTLMLSQVASYAHPAFTTTRIQFGWVNGRFFALLPTIAALLVARLWRRPVAQWVQAAYFVLASAFSIGCYYHYLIADAEYAALAVLLAAGLLAIVLAEPGSRLLSTRALGLGALLLVGAAFVCGTPSLQAYRARTRYQLLPTSAIGHRIHWLSSALAPVVDQPGKPHRIAITAGPNKLAGGQHIYYFLGSKLQNELVYVPVTRDGSVPVYDRDQPTPRLAGPSAWTKRVRESGASHVVVLAPAWHEYGWLGRMTKDFELVGANAISSLFRVRR